MSDPVARSEQLDEQLAVVKASSVLSTRTALKFFAGLAVLLLALLAAVGVLVARVNRTTSDTNAAVADQVEVLQGRNDELEGENAALTDVLRQATDAIIGMAETMRANGIEPPEVVLRPTTTTTQPGG